jgi:hypothetical protein
LLDEGGRVALEQIQPAKLVDCLGLQREGAGYHACSLESKQGCHRCHQKGGSKGFKPFLKPGEVFGCDREAAAQKPDPLFEWKGGECKQQGNVKV